MAITVADNFSYQGKKPLDGRDGFDTLAQMKAYPEASVYDGCMTYCKEDEKYYTFKASNTVDITTGKWREFSSGGGQTYSDFTGATASTAGAHGLVPAPSAGDEGKVLFGNGAWGALPSVDLSVLSNEANILSITEKAVGQNTDGRLIYQRTWNFPSGISMGGNAWTNIISNADTTVQIKNGVLGDEVGVFDFMEIIQESGVIKAFNARNAEVIPKWLTIQYTKTTDSPLPAGVKFAGVTSSGEVILEKTLTGISVESVSGQWVNVVDISTLSVGKLIDVVFRQTSEKCIAAGGARVNGSNLQIFSYVAFGINEVTIKYTLAS